MTKALGAKSSRSTEVISWAIADELAPATRPVTPIP